MLASSNLSGLKFVSCLGHGGFGIVFRTKEKKSEAETAVKFIFTSQSNEQEVIQECELSSTFDHVNIVKILTVSKHHFKADTIQKIFKNVALHDERSLLLKDTILWKIKRETCKTVEAISIQMPLCGENLRDWLHQGHNRGHVPTQIPTCRGIISGLKYLHNRRIIHRDLKPENVMFSSSSFVLPVLIGDFGFCRTLPSENASLSSAVGTRGYAAPEVVNGHYSFPADLFSLGLVLWEVLQPIPLCNRQSFFSRLVYDNETTLVQESIYAPLIINLTQKNPSARTLSLSEIEKVFPHVLHSSEELLAGLQGIENGGKIMLCQGLFQGQFIVEKDSVEIVGQDGTVLKGLKDKAALQVSGSGCYISHVKVVGDGDTGIGIYLEGSNNKVCHVTASGDGFCFSVGGNGNSLTNVRGSQAMCGVRVGGSSNILDGVELTGIRRMGVWMVGSSNNLEGINITKTTRKEAVGVWLHETSQTRISNLVCNGFVRDTNDFGLYIKQSTNSAVEDSSCGPVRVDGDRTTLTRVECGELLEIVSSAKDVELIDCSGRILSAPGPVMKRNCNFSKFCVKPINQISALKKLPL